jgi:hypothetical protein
MLIVGGALVGLTVLIAWMVIPLGRKWREMGRQLSPRLETLASLQERAEQRGSLLVRRDRLAKEIGVLVTPPPGAVEETDAEADNQEGGEKPEEADRDDAEAREQAQEKEQEPEEKEAPEPEKGPQAPELEAKLEQTFASAGAEMKLLTVKRVSRFGLRPEHFRMVGFQVETETKIESLVKLLHALEKGPRFMRVDRLRLRHEEGKPGRVSVSMEIVAYEQVAEG